MHARQGICRLCRRAFSVATTASARDLVPKLGEEAALCGLFLQPLVLGLDETGDTGLVIGDFADPVALARRDDDLANVHTRAMSAAGAVLHPGPRFAGDLPTVRLQLAQHLRLEVDVEPAK